MIKLGQMVLKAVNWVHNDKLGLMVLKESLGNTILKLGDMVLKGVNLVYSDKIGSNGLEMSQFGTQ